jgi:hypothetical protein
LSGGDEIIHKNVDVLERIPGRIEEGRIRRCWDWNGTGRAGNALDRRLYRHRGCKVVEVMACRLICDILEAVICQICNSFCGCTEVWRTLRPSHWEDEGEGDEGLVLSRACRINYTQFWDVVGVEADAIEPIAQISFVEKDRPILRIG